MAPDVKPMSLFAKICYVIKITLHDPSNVYLIVSMASHAIHNIYLNLRYKRQAKTSFMKDGYLVGSLGTKANSELSTIMERARKINFSSKDCRKGYIRNTYSDKQPVPIQLLYQFFILQNDDLKILTQVIEEISDRIIEAIGMAFRVTNVRCWDTFTGAAEAHANAWHVDGFPRYSYKLMIFPKGVGTKKGTIEIICHNDQPLLLEGEPGTWILFKNSELLHRGVAPKEIENRRVIEISIMQYPTLQLTPIFAGTNAKFPASPWGSQTT